MRLQFLTLIIFVCLSQDSPALGRHFKKNDELKTRKEVRSIVSAIVDAILDGDRKRRSEVVDDSEAEDGSLSETLSSKAKQKEGYENADDGVQKRQLTTARTFTKREDRESEQGLRLANVIATSDVNATDDQSEMLKEITEVNAPDKNSQEEDIDDDNDDDEESGAEDEDKFSSSGSGFSGDRSEMNARVQLELGNRSGLSDTQSKNKNILGPLSNNRAIKDAQFAETKYGSPYSESEKGSGDESEQESDDDSELGSDSRSSWGSGSDANDDVEEEESADEDFKNTTSGNKIGERTMDNNNNTSEEISKNNFSEIVNDAGNYENTSEKRDKDYISEKSKNGITKLSKKRTDLLGNSSAWKIPLNSSEEGKQQFVSEERKLDKTEENYGDTDSSASKIPLNSSEEGKGYFVSEERNISESQKDEKSNLTINQVSETLPEDNDKKVNVYNTSMNDTDQGGVIENTQGPAFVNPSDNNDKQFNSYEELMMRGKVLVDSPEDNDGTFETNETVLEKNEQGENSNANGSLDSLNAQGNSQWTDKNFEMIKNKNGETDTRFDEVSHSSPNNEGKQFTNDNRSLENSIGSPNKNFEKDERDFEKQSENLGNIVDPAKASFKKERIRSKKQSKILGNSADPENRNFEENGIAGSVKESGNPKSNIPTEKKNLVDYEVSHSSPNNEGKQFTNDNHSLENSIGSSNKNFEKDERDFEKQSENLGNIVDPVKASFKKERIGSKKQSKIFGNSVDPENRNFEEKNGIAGSVKESGNPKSNIPPTEKKNLVDDEVSHSSPNNEGKQFTNDNRSLENSIGSPNKNFEKYERDFEKQSENLGNIVDPAKASFEKERIGSKKQSKILGYSVDPENRNFEEKDEIAGSVKESGNPKSNIPTEKKNLVDDEMELEKLGNNMGLGNSNKKDKINFEHSKGVEGNPLTGSSMLERNEPVLASEEKLGSLPEDNMERVDYRDQVEGSRGYGNNYYNVENGNPYRYEDRYAREDSSALLDKRNSIPGVVGIPSFTQGINDNALDGLVSDVGEPWIKDFLTKTLEMAANGDKAIKTPTQDVLVQHSEKDVTLVPWKLNSENTKPLQPNSADENLETASKEMMKPRKDDMPLDATISSDDDAHPGNEDDRDDDDVNNYDKDDHEPGDVRANIFEAGTSSALPALNKMNTGNEIASNNIKNQVPVPRLHVIEVPMKQTLKYINQPPIPAIRIVPAPAQLPVTSQIPANRPIIVTSHISMVPPVNIVPEKAASSPSSQTGAAILPGEDLKGMDTKQGIIAELDNVIDNGIENIGTISTEEKLESDFKETQLLQVLKDAIPVGSRRPKDINNDIKQEIEDLKDYASALTETAGLSPTNRDDLAKKLARDLLDEIKVSEERKEGLLRELLAFVTAMEVERVREGLAEVRTQVLSFASKQSDDPTKIRGEAVRLLDEFLQNLPLPKDQIQEKESRLLQSKLLSSLVKEGERRALRAKIKKALVDLVADKLL